MKETRFFPRFRHDSWGSHLVGSDASARVVRQLCHFRRARVLEIRCDTSEIYDAKVSSLFYHLRRKLKIGADIMVRSRYTRYWKKKCDFANCRKLRIWKTDTETNFGWKLLQSDASDSDNDWDDRSFRTQLNLKDRNENIFKNSKEFLRIWKK